jgi:hypothetical protein
MTGGRVPFHASDCHPTRRGQICLPHRAALLPRQHEPLDLWPDRLAVGVGRAQLMRRCSMRICCKRSAKRLGPGSGPRAQARPLPAFSQPCYILA